MLIRSGVKRVRIVDFDTVSLSSLNRHSFALREDVGTLKVDCIKKYIHKIFPHLEVECVNVYVTADNVRKLLISDFAEMTKALGSKEAAPPLVPPHPSYIVDCIDNLDAKVELIAACVQNSLKLMVSGGGGMKTDPTKLQIRDISDCKYDKLIMRLKR
jgi:tRNA A37 threonylcarbamoyladenosine dehydratase